jgi:hypothetical protein
MVVVNDHIHHILSRLLIKHLELQEHGHTFICLQFVHAPLCLVRDVVLRKPCVGIVNQLVFGGNLIVLLQK